MWSVGLCARAKLAQTHTAYTDALHSTSLKFKFEQQKKMA